MEKIGQLIGGSKYIDDQYSILLIGSYGSGKTTLMKMLLEISKSTDHHIQYFDGKDNSYQFNFDPNMDEHDQVKVIFSDNVNESKIHHILAKREYSNVHLFSIHPSMSINTVDYDQAIILRKMTEQEIIELLKKRVNLFGNSECFTEEFYKIIGKYSFGNPLFALINAEKLAKMLYAEKEINFTKIMRDFGRNISSNTTRYLLFNDYRNLTTKQAELVNFFLQETDHSDSGMTITKISQITNDAHSLLSRYFDDLVEKKFLEYTKRGREKFFYLNLYARFAIEDELLDSLTKELL